MEGAEAFSAFRLQSNLDDLLKQCEKDRLPFCDTIFRLVPSERNVPVCSFYASRLKVLEDKIACSLNKYPVSTTILEATGKPVRVFKLEFEDEDEGIVFCHLIECLHKPNASLQAYVAGPVRSQGYILPLLEMALSYEYTSLANICRIEMGFLVRELLDTDSVSDALSIVEMLANWHSTADGEDGSFQCQSGTQLKRHPVIRQCMHYLRAMGWESLAVYENDFAKLPSITLIYLVIFAGMDHEQKRIIFARALKQRATQLAVEFHRKEEERMRRMQRTHELVPSSEPGQNWDRVIVNFISTPVEEIIASILTQWAQSHRPLTRSRSADSRFNPLSKIKQVVDNTRRRAESMPPSINTNNPTAVSANNNNNDTHDDPMDICSGSSVFSIAPIIDFSAITRLPALPTRDPSLPQIDSSLTISNCFSLVKTNSGNYVSKEAFYYLPQPLLSQLPVGTGGALVVSMHTNNENTELVLVGTIYNQQMFTTVSVSIMADVDTDPYMDENPPLGIEPKPVHFTFRCHQPSVLVKKNIRIPQHYYTVHRVNSPTTMNVCVYIKSVFTLNPQLKV